MTQLVDEHPNSSTRPRVAVDLSRCYSRLLEVVGSQISTIKLLNLIDPPMIAVVY